MNVQRFTARNSRDALNLVRQSLGSDAIVLSTRPCHEGIEVLAMAPDAVRHFERVAGPAASVAPTTVPAAAAASPAAPAAAAAPTASARQGSRATTAEPTSVAQDAESLAMSTLSFQDYVRERMLRRRRTEMTTPLAADGAPSAAARAAPPSDESSPLTPACELPPASALPAAASAGGNASVEFAATRRQQQELLDELRAMKGLIEARFGALAFMEKLQRQPRQARLAQRMLDCGFSPALVRTLVDDLPPDVDELDWAAGMLENCLATGEHKPPLEDAGGVYALIGATGVGKTTSTAKLAAAFAARHGASQLGLITLDAYRVAAHEQLRTYGRILGVPVHTAHDRASLEDLLELLAGKRMVLIDTAGMAQRDSRTRELLDMLSYASIQKLLVVNASAQGETVEDQIASYRAAQCRGVVLSKIDEAAKIGPALDTMVRHKLEVVAVANGQRVPEDWHRLSAATLVQHAWRTADHGAWQFDPTDVALIFAGAGNAGVPHASAAGRAAPVAGVL